MIIPMPRHADGDRSAGAVLLAPAAPALALQRRAAALSKDGKWDEAVSAWREVLHATPGDADAAHELGLLLARLGKHDEAVTSFERALHYAPEAVATKVELGRAFLSLNRPKDARFNFADLLARDPSNVDALAGTARALRTLGQFEDALKVTQQGVSIDADHPAILLEKAQALVSLKRPEEAVEPFERVLAHQPDQREAGLALAKILIELKRPAEAVIVLRKTAAAHPADADVLLDFGSALLAGRLHGEAVDAFRRALVLKPNLATAHANLALALFGLGRLDEAMAACETCLAIEPNSGTAHFTRGCLHLVRGEFGPGWDDYEYRFSMGGNKAIREDIAAPPWCGEDPKGKSILVLGEQANGDYFQFSRYAAALRGLGADVSLFVPRSLKRVLSSLPITILDALGPNINTDFQIQMMSLPQRFQRLGLPIPMPPYLAAEPDLRERWRTRIGSNGLRVGISWQGWHRGGPQDARSFQLEHLRPLMDVPGIRLISLQIGTGVEQIERLLPDMRVETLGPDFDSGQDNFIDTAAAMASLDLIITPDTGLAHLAGALGKPIWIALIEIPEWRWQLEVTESYWYPAAKLFRQPKRDDWDSVFSKMAETLHVMQRHGDLPGL